MKKLSLLKTLALVCVVTASFSTSALAEDAPTYPEVKAQYDAGSPISLESLRGTWKYVEYVQVKCPSSDPVCNKKDMNGLKDKNGVDKDTLTFSDFVNPRTKKTELGVSIVNIAGPNTNQGPYPLRAEEPQFAFKAAGTNGLSNDFISANSCRFLNGSQDLILCSQLRFDSHNYPGTVFIYDGQVVGYKKVQ